MVFYFVQRGETLYAIAKRYQTTVHAIVAANRLEDPNAICAGQALIIPRPGEVPSPPPGGIVHLVRPGETVFHLATKFGTTPHDILRANQIAHPEFILPGQQVVIPEPMEAGEDWPMYGRTPGRGGASPVILEGVPLPGWTHTPRKKGIAKPSAPVVRYERVYAGLGDGHFYSLDRGTGRVKWRILAAAPSSLVDMRDHALSTPAIFEGLAYLCGPDGLIHAVDAYTGQAIWTVATGGPITSSPAVSGGVLYLGCWDEHLYALEAKTGAVAWKRHLGGPIVQPVAVGDDQVYAVTASGALCAVDAQTGDSCWMAATEPDQAPVFAEVVLMAGHQAFDPRTGQVLWSVEAAGGSPVARVDQIIYPGGAVDLFAGVLRWIRRSESTTQTPISEGITVVPSPETPVIRHVATGTLVLGIGVDRRLHAWDISDGHTVWTTDLGVPSAQPPAVAPRQIIIAMEDGSLSTFRMKPDRSAT